MAMEKFIVPQKSIAFLWYWCKIYLCKRSNRNTPKRYFQTEDLSQFKIFCSSLPSAIITELSEEKVNHYFTRISSMKDLRLW